MDNMGAKTPLLFFFLLSLYVCVQSWTGNVCTTLKVRYQTRSTCANWWCFSHHTVTYSVVEQQQRCCLGWQYNNGDQNCNIPICQPPCQNGGTCTAPNQCQCPIQHPGQFCDGSLCSHQLPCYPGTCIPPHTCNCASGFTTRGSAENTCLTIEDNRNIDIKIYEMHVNISQSPRAVTSPNEVRWFTADSTGRKDMDYVWLNQRGFNRLKTTCSSQFLLPDLPPKPDYVGDAKFGVVKGRVEVWLSKVPLNQFGQRVSSLNSTFPCRQAASPTQPESGFYQCNLDINDFDRVLEHGDFLRITYRTEGGGFRELLDKNTNPPRHYATQNYTSVNNSQSVEFRFDFKPPIHCDESNNCRSDEKILDVPDITKMAPLKISWSGWQDADSQMYRYSMEVFKMTPTTDNKLEIRVDRALKPLINRQVFAANYTPQEYTPPEPGMYSVILEAGDLANNTKYVRRLCLYDPSSQITLDPRYKLFVASASNASNYTYQTNLSDLVVVMWVSYFRNAFHEENSLLGEVLMYPVQLENGRKFIGRDGPLDDHEGSRTVDGIPNARGIVNFQLGYARDHEGGQHQPVKEISPSSGWLDLGLNTTFSLPPTARPSEADTVTVWVKATDAMGNERTERTRVTFDSTPPVAQDLNFYMNVPVAGVDFSSVFDLMAKDQQSGISYVLWTFRRRDRTIIYQEKVPGKKAGKETNCAGPLTTCDCTSAGDCFSFNQSYAVSNCHLMVEKENLKTEVISVTADVTNMAGLVTTLNLTKRDVSDLNGTQAYLPPQNVSISLTTSDSVRITWIFLPSCFRRTGLWVIVNNRNNSVHKDATQFDLTGLDPGTSYTIYMVAAYEGNQTNDSEPVYFTTVAASKNEDLKGTIAGAAVGFLILVALVTCIVLFVLWQRGKIFQKEGVANRSMRRVPTVFNNVRKQATKGFSNVSYAAGQDEVYMYGEMTFATRQPWHYDKTSVTLIDSLVEGKFASIYKARMSIGNVKGHLVAAKMLKPGFSQEESLKMMAKINFFACLKEHDNILQFIGAIIDHSDWGPVMVTEYCEGGQLDQWLVSRRKNVTQATVEKLFHFSLGIAKGMNYLASKQIVHTRLAARNILLTAQEQVKVAGFGPQSKESGKEEGEKRARIPVKWAAPEVLMTKPPTEKSDVWSFGVVLWEIFSLGEVPYPALHSSEIGTRLKGGYRLEKPELADNIHYKLMCDCWRYEAAQRPTFSAVCATLAQQTPASTGHDVYYDACAMKME